MESLLSALCIQVGPQNNSCIACNCLHQPMPVHGPYAYLLVCLDQHPPDSIMH